MYISGTFYDLMNRLHQLPTSTGDLASFKDEAPLYSGVIDFHNQFTINIEYNKKRRAFNLFDYEDIFSGSNVVIPGPDSLPYLAMWLKADAIEATDGDKVSIWMDSSSSGNFASGQTVPEYPTYRDSSPFGGKPRLDFNTGRVADLGSSRLVTKSFLGGAFDKKFTCYMMSDCTGLAQFNQLALISNQGLRFFISQYDLNNNGIANFAAFGLDTPSSLTPINSTFLYQDYAANMCRPLIHSFSWNGSTKTNTFGASKKAVVDTGDLQVGGALTIGTLDSVPGGYYWPGHIYEVLVFNSGVSSGDHNVVMDYLFDKYDLGQVPEKYIIFDGNSLVKGGSSDNFDDGFCAQVMNRNYTGLLTEGWDYINIGKGGFGTLDLIERVTNSVDSMYRADALNIYAPFEISNDIAHDGSTYQEAFDNYVSLCAGRKALGFKVMAYTMLPRSSDVPVDFESGRQFINQLIRDNWQDFADILLDVGADPFIGISGAQMNTTYYPDQIHLTPAGSARLALYTKSGALALEAN